MAAARKEGKGDEMVRAAGRRASAAFDEAHEAEMKRYLHQYQAGWSTADLGVQPTASMSQAKTRLTIKGPGSEKIRSEAAAIMVQTRFRTRRGAKQYANQKVSQMSHVCVHVQRNCGLAASIDAPPLSPSR